MVLTVRTYSSQGFTPSNPILTLSVICIVDRPPVIDLSDDSAGDNKPKRAKSDSVKMPTPHSGYTAIERHYQRVYKKLEKRGEKDWYTQLKCIHHTYILYIVCLMSITELHNVPFFFPIQTQQNSPQQQQQQPPHHEHPQSHRRHRISLRNGPNLHSNFWKRKTVQVSWNDFKRH